MLPGYQFTSSDVIAMAKAVQGRIALNKYCKCDRYNVQNICKCLSNVLPALFRTSSVMYDENLHSFMQQRQSEGDFGDITRCLGIQGWQDIVELAEKINTPDWARIPTIVDDSYTRGVNWSTVWIHLCEVRQVLQIFPIDVLKQILETDPTEYETVLKQTFFCLIENASRGACFCVVLVRAVAVHLGISIKREHRQNIDGVNQKDARLLTVELARLGFSPKADLGGIPEWMTLFNGVLLFIGHCPKQGVLSQSAALRVKRWLLVWHDLRRLFVSQGIPCSQLVKGKRKVFSRVRLLQIAFGKSIEIAPRVMM